MSTSQITYITTCKGRLHHLKQSLPVVARQPELKVIVVDYDCPDGTGEWVKANFPSVEVVKVANAPFFQLSHARNVGAAAANTPWLAFFDADVVVGDGFFNRISGILKPGIFFLPKSDSPNLWAPSSWSARRSSRLADMTRPSRIGVGRISPCTAI